MTGDFHISDGVLTIDGSARYLKSQQFAGRSDFRKAVVCGGVGFAEEEVFADCASLEEVVLPEGLVNIGVADFASCTSLEKINIPSSVKTIEEGAFLSCESLRGISLPDGLETIADLAFQETGLEAVSIPPTVLSIGEEAFFECVRLKRADILGKNTKIGLNAFGSDYALVEGYVAPGFPEEKSPPAELLYSLLWASCPERHTSETTERASAFIRTNSGLVMERILKSRNVPALTGIAGRRLLKPEETDGYVRTAIDLGMPEITALLLSAKAGSAASEGEFDL